MKVHFGQIYIQPGVTFPFSHHFQQRLSEQISALVTPSTSFASKYGNDWELMFRISAKTEIDDNDIRGPSVFKADKDVEYTIFLPFDVIAGGPQVPELALQFLLKACCHVFRGLDIDTAVIEDRTQSIIETICSDPKTFT